MPFYPKLPLLNSLQKTERVPTYSNFAKLEDLDDGIPFLDGFGSLHGFLDIPKGGCSRNPTILKVAC